MWVVWWCSDEHYFIQLKQHNITNGLVLVFISLFKSIKVSSLVSLCVITGLFLCVFFNIINSLFLLDLFFLGYSYLVYTMECLSWHVQTFFFYNTHSPHPTQKKWKKNNKEKFAVWSYRQLSVHSKEVCWTI